MTENATTAAAAQRAELAATIKPMRDLAGVLLATEEADPYELLSGGLQLALTPVAWVYLCEALEVCPVHVCDEQICRDDEADCQHDGGAKYGDADAVFHD